MSVKAFLNELKSKFKNISPNSEIGEYFFKGINVTDGFGSPGGSWSPKEYPAYEIEKGSKQYLIRIIPKEDKIVIEAIHLSNMLINYKLNDKNFIESNDKIKLLENYVMTVNHRRSFSDVKEVMHEVGMLDNIIFEIDSKNFILAHIVDSLLKWANYREMAKEKLRERVVEKSDLKSEIGENRNPVQQPLNQILFGPPGTGKTYKLLQLIDQMGLVSKPSGKQLDYKTFASGYYWWQIMAMCLYDIESDSVPHLLEHDLIKGKFGISTIKNPSQRLWGTLQNHTVENCPNVKMKGRHGELIFYKEVNSNWRLDNKIEFKQQFPFLVEEWEQFKSSGSSWTMKKNFLFTTCHQSLNYEDFIEGIKPVLSDSEDKDSIDIGLEYEIRKGLFYQACDSACQLAGYLNLQDSLNDSKESRKKKFETANEQNRIYAFFMDEINRANVSAVFGELITLIEDDKRLGAENEIIDTVLPYSQTVFGVPSNLFIIGTMNTADRSVEALDTALRRRFYFKEMLPNAALISSQRKIWELLWKYEKLGWDDEPYKSKEIELYALLGVNNEDDIIGDVWEKIKKEKNKSENQISYFDEVTFSGINLQEMLISINYRLELILSKDHTIGHAWLMNVNSFWDLQLAFKNKILPLLQEYFYNNYAKIGLVLGGKFVEQNIVKVIFAKFKDEQEIAEDYDGKINYSLKNPMELTIEDFKTIYE